jgi:DNA helicase-2/ATP-dependent DNA helicase PcrA
MSQFLQGLNDEQFKAVSHTNGPLLIVAGAGTGKTKVITTRIAHIIEQKLAKPDEILALTFTEKAAGEMEERLDRILPLGSYDLWISTFHSFCERILKQFALDIGIPNDFKLMDDIAQWILVHDNLDKFDLDYYRPLGNPNKFIDALLSHFSKCKDELITPESYLKYAEDQKLNSGSVEVISDEEKEVEIKRLTELANAYHVYQKLLLDKESLDFGDLINYTLELFQKRPNILRYYQKKFKFIMVDEFQDTNYAQYALVKLLSQTPDKNLVVVGDDDQSIYKFRGASVSNIMHFKEDYPNLKQVTLINNYRSSQNILDLAYNFIKANDPNRLEPQLGINKRLVSHTEEKGVIQVLEGGDLNSELDLVIKRILELKKAYEDSTWNDFAILIRSNSAAEEILPRLDAASIPYYFVASRGLYKKPLIFELLCYLKLLDNYHESSSLYKVLTFPEFNLTPHELSLITGYAHKKTLSFYEALKDIRVISGITENGITQAERLISLIHSHSNLAKEKTVVETFITIIHELGIDKRLEAETFENAENRELLEQFYKRIEKYSGEYDDKSLNAFMNHLKLEMEAGSDGHIKFDPNIGPELLKVMTVHASKGLEFRFVFIVNMVDQRFPTRAKGESIPIPENLIKDILPEGDIHLEEERRLFYVAVTRAKTHLFFSWAKDYGGTRLKKPSLFLQETGLVAAPEKGKKSDQESRIKKTTGLLKHQVYQILPTKFSFTELKTFEQCPLEYKFRSYLRLPLPGNHYMSFGKTIHSVLEHFAKQYQNISLHKQASLFGENESKITIPDFEIIKQLYEAHWVDEWYKTKKEKAEYKASGLVMLQFVYDDFIRSKPKIRFVEEGFKLKLGDFDFVGKIDRADIGDKGLVIVDYKTNNAPKTKAKQDLDQLRIYQWAAEEQFGEKVEGLYYWHLKDNQKVYDDLASPEQISELKHGMLETIDKIRHTIKFDLFSEEHSGTKQHNCQFEGWQ